MNEDNKVISFRQPDVIDDLLTVVAARGARRLLEQAIEAEVEGFLATMKDLKWPDGRDRIVRYGHGPERTIQTGIGAVGFRQTRGGSRPRLVHPAQPPPDEPPIDPLTQQNQWVFQVDGRFRRRAKQIALTLFSWSGHAVSPVKNLRGSNHGHPKFGTKKCKKPAP